MGSKNSWFCSIFSMGFLTLAGTGRAWIQCRWVGWSVKGLLQLKFPENSRWFGFCKQNCDPREIAIFNVFSIKIIKMAISRASPFGLQSPNQQVFAGNFNFNRPLTLQTTHLHWIHARPVPASVRNPILKIEQNHEFAQFSVWGFWAWLGLAGHEFNADR